MIASFRPAACLLALGSLALAALFPTFLTAATPPPAPRFAHETSDLKADPAARFGKLPNGLHYVILANREPRERASLRLVVMAGSLHETEDQRGLAHFLEHMAFNGSTHYPPGTLIEYFQRLGMNFGGDTNAYTSFDHTAYMLELPDTKPATLAEGFKVFGDYAAGLLLVEKEIERERGIILSEKRARDSVEFRQFVAEYKFLLGETLFGKRMPIGEASVIEQAPRATFVDLYDTWYRPERMAVVAVGDFEPAAIEQLITSTFSSFTPRAAARPDPHLGVIPAFDGTRVLYHHEPEAGATTVAIQSMVPAPPEPDTSAQRLKHLPRDLAAAMLNRRLEILSKKEGAPFSRGTLVAHDAFEFYRNAAIELVCQPKQWSEALVVAEQELRRALEHGFQPAELREIVANFRNSLEQAVKTAATRRSSDLAGEIVDALVSGDVFTTPADNLALYAPALEKVTPEQCTQALRDAFSAPGRFVSVMGNADLHRNDAAPAPATAATTVSAAASAAATPPANPSSAESAEARILNVYTASRAVAVAAPEAVADTAFAYTDFGAPSEVASRLHVEDLDLDLVNFSNGVRFNFKKTDFEAGKIRMTVRVGAGQMTEPKDQPGLGVLANLTLAPGGLGKHSADELKRILAGRTVGTGFNVSSDALVFSATTNQDDLLLQLQLVSAFITDPGFRPEALRQARKLAEQFYTRMDHTPDGPLQLDFTRLLASGDVRLGFPKRDELNARTLEEVRNWLTPQFATGPIEIALVGDLDPEAAVAAVSRTLGALPKRAPKPGYETERQVKIPEPFAKDYTVPTEIPKGLVALYWPTTDARDIYVVRRLTILAEIFSDRLRVKVREELGDSYSPSAGSTPSDTYRNYGFLNTVMTIDPAKAAAVAEAALAIAGEIEKNGVTEDELERAKKPIVTSIREASRTNEYWIRSVLGSAQEFPQRLEWRRTIHKDFDAISKPDIDALAKKYLTPTRAFRATVLPQAK
jgi:zinc protease